MTTHFILSSIPSRSVKNLRSIKWNYSWSLKHALLFLLLFVLSVLILALVKVEEALVSAMIEVWTKRIKKQKKDSGNRKVSLGRMNKGTEVWKSSCCSTTTSHWIWQGCGWKWRHKWGWAHTCYWRSRPWTLSFFYRIMVSVFQL